MHIDLRTKATLLKILMIVLICIAVVLAVSAIVKLSEIKSLDAEHEYLRDKLWNTKGNKNYYDEMTKTSKKSFDNKRDAMIFVFLTFAIGSLIWKYLYPQFKIYQSGLAGEDRASKELKKLEKPYKVYSNVKIKLDGDPAEFDFVVVGPNGIFIIENKNYNGTIEGHTDDEKWTQKKSGKGSSPYTTTIYNPISQMKRQKYILINYLKGKGIEAFVTGFIYFSNYYVNLRISGNRDYISSVQQKDLLDKIRNFRSQYTLNENQIHNIIMALK